MKLSFKDINLLYTGAIYDKLDCISNDTVFLLFTRWMSCDCFFLGGGLYLKPLSVMSGTKVMEGPGGSMS